MLYFSLCAIFLQSVQEWLDCKSNLVILFPFWKFIKLLKSLEGTQVWFVFYLIGHDQDSFPNLEELILSGQASKMISWIQFSEHLFCKLKCLEVCNDESKIFPLDILQRFHHLEILQLWDSWSIWRSWEISTYKKFTSPFAL